MLITTVEDIDSIAWRSPLLREEEEDPSGEELLTLNSLKKKGC